MADACRVAGLRRRQLRPGRCKRCGRAPLRAGAANPHVRLRESSRAPHATKPLGNRRRNDDSLQAERCARKAPLSLQPSASSLQVPGGCPSIRSQCCPHGVAPPKVSTTGAGMNASAEA